MPARATQTRGFLFGIGQRCTYNRTEQLYAKPLVYRVSALRDPGRHVDRSMYKGLCVMKKATIFTNGLTLTEWETLSNQIKKRDGFRCRAQCGCTALLTVHHIIPRDENGTNDPNNLVTLCADCHNEIEDTSIRTRAGVETYVPRWHATVSWYPTIRERQSRAAIAKPKNKQPKKQLTERKPPKERPPAEIITRECPSCGRTFVLRYSNLQKYCTPYCKARVSTAAWYIEHPWVQRSPYIREWIENMPCFQSQ